MRADPSVIELLDRYLSIELAGHKQYLLDAACCDDWGLQRLGRQQLAYSQEETDHARRLAARILFLEGRPAMLDYRPPRSASDVPALLLGNLDLIAAALAVLREGSRVAEGAGDFVSRDLFNEMLVDEEAHTRWLEVQLGLVERLGLETYLQTQASD